MSNIIAPSCIGLTQPRVRVSYRNDGWLVHGSALSTLPIVRVVKVVNHSEVYKVLGG